MFKNLFKRKERTPELKVTKPTMSKEEYTELYTDSINNARYIRAAIKSMDSVIAGNKGRAVAARERRENAQEQIEWYKDKLEEEEVMVKHYGLLAEIND